MNAVVFDSELEAKAAFELGGKNLVFRCNQCGQNHRVGSKAARKCFNEASNQFPSYKVNMNHMCHYASWLDDTWFCWGREDAAVEYYALRKYLDNHIWHPVPIERCSFRQYMLALSDEALAAVERKEFEKVSAICSSRINEDFIRRLNRLMELAAYLKIPRPPALPLPVVATFVTDLQISCGGEEFIDLERFLQGRVEKAVGHLEPDLRECIDVDRIVFNLAARPTMWQDTRVVYFLSHGAYLVTVHDWVCNSYTSHGSARYESYQYLVFYLRNYQYPEIIDMFFEEKFLCAEELIDRLMRTAEARRDAA